MKKKRNNSTRGHKSPKSFPQATGIARMSRDGFIFVEIEGQDDDVYVKSTRTRNALNGDTVRVAIYKEKARDRRREGEVVEIVERSKKPFVGVLHFVGAQAWVLMQSRTMPYDIAIDQQQALEMGGKSGMKAAVVVDRWEKNEINPWGHVTDVLGYPGENDTEMHAILAEFGLPYRFEKEVEDAADSISEAITAEDIKGRKDFRDTFTFTIDPADAKDFDDALSFKALKNGNYEVGVHIADVSYYVKPGSVVDKEAQTRGTSVYLVDRTVPMLPEKLCNKLCSLRPDEDKLTFSTVFEISPKAEVVKQWIGRTVIRSNARLNYEQAQDIITGAPAAKDFSEELNNAITILNGIASILRENKFKNGAIRFERPEMKVEIDENGKPTGVHQAISNESHWLIEEFMLLANRTVAEFIATDGKMNMTTSKKAKTFIYRVHAEPNTEKIQGLRDFAGNFGYKLGETGSGKEISKSLAELFDKAKDKPEFGALEMLALRSMAKATYTTDNIGHYGLAFKYYTHFTSPIRRYPDTMVHRLLTLYLDGKESQNKDYYEQQAKHASEREIIAAEAERASIKYKVVEFMQDKLGQEFDGMISGLTEWGMYVEIEPTKIEGMVPLRTIKSDFFEFDENHYRLVGKRSRKVFRLGDSVRIKVKATNLEQKLLDYELIEKIK
ncbi:MAG: ribonuclease R [Bacteroidales bacterium]|nr:ribonuclease R [Bacteroidales bacterium]